MASSLTQEESGSKNRSSGASEMPKPLDLTAKPAPVTEHKANILLVDDREDKRLVIETVIADLGQNIIHATSGREALRHLLTMEFAVILLDVNMPGMDGFETALLIRQRKSLENIPIIFISAISDTETHVSRGYSLGAVDYILAPIVPEILRAKVGVFVELFKITDQVKRQAEDLRAAQNELEKRVVRRTQELAIANQSLQNEIKERRRAEEELRVLNGALEQRVADRTAELRAANKELETFSYSIAHDLRAPFRQIHSYAEILELDCAQSLSPDARQYLGRIAAKSKEMEEMVDDLLRLFVIAKQPLEVEETDLNLLVGEVVASLKRETGDRQIEWKIGDLPHQSCNRALLKQVFENLLSNAVKYTRPRSAAQICVNCESIDGKNVISIGDNGVGFDMGQVDRLFGVFQRLHKSDEFEGTGVGLALVSRIIAKHGGRVWAKGFVNQGATFYFTLEKSGHDQQ